MNGFCQEESIIINGTLYTSNKKISDIHIINLNNYLGTISNEIGEFKILAKLNDTLLFSSIEYEVKKIRVSKHMIESRNFSVILIPAVNQLNEVFVGLTGNLDFDLKNKPKNTGSSKGLHWKRQEQKKNKV